MYRHYKELKREVIEIVLNKMTVGGMVVTWGSQTEWKPIGVWTSLGAKKEASSSQLHTVRASWYPSAPPAGTHRGTRANEHQYLTAGII